MNVAAQSAAAKENFAIWYSYYRTRIALIKSAASLAFSPLNDTKRIGFITMQPKSSVGAAGINPLRFLPVGDFTPAAGGQKDKWFAKLFEQIPAGASPAREGLARVGRYYGGKEDSINTDMPATGANDPIQYTCQQNFAIMTTDGYWNGQTESLGPGLFGGGLQLDGVTKVGQQDGDLSDPYSPRPIWDGTSNSIHVVTNKTNAYTDNVCSLSGTYRSTFQHQREVSMTTKDSTLTTKRTIQYFQEQSQVYAHTVQTTFTSTSDMQTTEQFAEHREHYVEEKYQHVKSEEQTTKVTEQWELQTSQSVAQTFQTRKIDTRVWKTEEQWQTAKSQSVQTTTQYVMQVDQYKLGRKQVYRHQYQTLAKIGDDEIGVPQSGTCTPIPGVVRCEDRDVLPDGSSRLVDPNTCTTGPGVTVGPGPGYLKTTCTDGPSALPYGPVANCTPGVTAATALNNWVETRCDLVRRHAHALQRHLRRRSADPGRVVLHLHLHASAGQQPGDAGRIVRPRRRRHGARLDHDHVHPAAGPDQLPVDTVGALHGRTAGDRRLVRDDDLHEAGRHGGLRARRGVRRQRRPDAALSEGHVRSARGPRRRGGAERLVHGGNGRRRQDRLRDDAPRDRMRWRARCRPASTARRPTPRTTSRRLAPTRRRRTGPTSPRRRSAGRPASPCPPPRPGSRPTAASRPERTTPRSSPIRASASTMLAPRRRT